MQKDLKQEESFSPEVQEVMRSIVSAIRSVKLYPSNNPVYSKSINKSFEALDNFLQTDTEYRIGVRKAYFTFRDMPLGKDAEMNMSIAQDLFTKGIREIIFANGLTEEELLGFYQALVLSAEELDMKSGISSILWENDSLHVRVTEAGLDEVITIQTARGWEDKTSIETGISTLFSEGDSAKKQIGFPGRTLVLVDLMTDPVGFSANMIELAKQTKAEHETVEDRLFALYKEAGRKINEQHPSQRETLYEGLAKSVLALDPCYRNGFIAGKLYGELDAEIAEEESAKADQQLPSAIHEVQTGRFSDTWTVQQVATLLKETVSKQNTPSIPPSYPTEIEANPVAPDLITIAQEMTVYSAEDMEELKALGDAGMELDTVRSSVHTFISLIPLVKSPRREKPQENDVTVFSGVIQQLENMLNYFLKKKDYQYATRIIHAFHLKVESAFQPKMMDALKKAAAKPFIIAAINEIRKHPKNSPGYHSIYTYLSAFERESTEVILKLLAEEKDKAVRIFYLDLVKDIGKNQMALLGRHLSDVRWYFVRNIVNILGESKASQSIAFLLKAADHQNVRIRQEVIRGLVSIGGKKAVGVLAKFLKDKDDEVKIMAIQAFSSFPDISVEEAKPLVDFLDAQPLKKKEQGLTLEAIKALGKIGGHDTAEFLKKYTRIRWWKSRELQEELHAAALYAMGEIKRRRGNG
jgi:HEAT repeat protein